MDHPRRKPKKCTLADLTRAMAAAAAATAAEEEAAGDDNDDADEGDLGQRLRLQCLPGAAQRIYCLYDVDNAYIRELCQRITTDSFEQLSEAGVRIEALCRAVGDAEGTVRVVGKSMSMRWGWLKQSVYRAVVLVMKQMSIILEQPHAHTTRPADVVVPPVKQVDRHRNGHLLRRPARKKPNTTTPATKKARTQATSSQPPPSSQKAAAAGAAATGAPGEAQAPAAAAEEEQDEDEDDGLYDDDAEDDDDGMFQLLEFD